MIAKTSFVSSAVVWVAAGCAAGGAAPRAPNAEPTAAVEAPSPMLRGASETPWPAPTVVAAPALRTQTRPLPHDIAQLRGLRDVTISLDGARIAYTVRAPIFDPKAKPADDDAKAGWKVEQQLFVVERAGGAPRQLTFGDDPVMSPRFSPDGQSIAFVRKKGNKPALHVMSLAGGEPRAVALGGYEPQQFDWVPGRDALAFTAARPPSDEVKQARWKRGGAHAYDSEWEQSHLVVVPLGGGEPRHINAGTDTVVRFAWSPDGKRVAMVVSTSSDPLEAFVHHKLVVADADGANPRTLDQGDPDKPFVIPQISWSPDARKLAYLVTSRGGMSHIDELRVRALDGSPATDAAAKLDLELTGMVWAGDGRSLIAAATARTVTRLVRLPIDGGAAKEIAIGRRVLGGLQGDRTGRYLVAASATTMSPLDPVVIDAEGGTVKALASINPQVTEWTLGRTEVVTWKNREGIALEGLYTQTTQAGPGAPPLVVIPHGGPDSVSVEDFSAWAQYFSARGYAVFAPNYRGGTGYGRAFYEANRGRLGEIELVDIESGVDALVASGKADAARLFYGSWSWGGYLSAWTLGHTSRYRAFMVGAGVIDVVVQYVTSDINHGPSADWEFKGRPWSQPDAFERANPARSLANARAPTLIIHGENDSRVPFVNGQILYRALRDRGVDVTFWAYPREPHGFQEPAHTEHFLELWGAFFDRQLTAGSGK
ncbi:MAG TPA: S9 family peptidase [Kofleriaceae bacterium]|nr:S9 family peptidase [Kofleriaceae bacterium]